MNDIGLFLIGVVVGSVAIGGVLWLMYLRKSNNPPRVSPAPVYSVSEQPTPYSPPRSSEESLNFPTEAVFIRAEFKVPRTEMEKRAWETLTPRQRDVALLVSRGLSNAEVASKLGIQKSTVASYLKEVYSALGIHSRTALANLVRDMAL